MIIQTQSNMSMRPRPRPSICLVLRSIRQSNQIPSFCIRSLSVSTQERPSKPSVVQAAEPSSSIRPTKHFETLYPSPRPPRNDKVSVTYPTEESSPSQISTSTITSTPTAQQVITHRQSGPTKNEP